MMLCATMSAARPPAAAARAKVATRATVPSAPSARATLASATTRATMTMTMMMLTTLASASDVAAIECNLVTPCTPPPPNGEPRYTLPGAINSPGEDAVARYMAKLEAANAVAAPEPRVDANAPEAPVDAPAE